VSAPTPAERLRAFVHARCAARPGAAELRDDTPLVSGGLIDSLRLTELILFLEELREAPLDVEQLQPGSFRDLATIRRVFLGETGARP
jgi:acyl carrier protein